MSSSEFAEKSLDEWLLHRDPRASLNTSQDFLDYVCSTHYSSVELEQESIQPVGHSSNDSSGGSGHGVSRLCVCYYPTLRAQPFSPLPPLSSCPYKIRLPFTPHICYSSHCQPHSSFLAREEGGGGLRRKDERER